MRETEKERRKKISKGISRILSTVKGRDIKIPIFGFTKYDFPFKLINFEVLYTRYFLGLFKSHHEINLYINSDESIMRDDEEGIKKYFMNLLNKYLSLKEDDVKINIIGEEKS